MNENKTRGVEYAAEKLREGNYTVVIAGEKVFCRSERGIKPLLEIIESGEDVRGYVAADKIVGKAAALLYAYMGVSEVYACVASESAVKACERYGIKLSFCTLTHEIINRRGDGICPMESAVAATDDSETAYGILSNLLRK